VNSLIRTGRQLYHSISDLLFPPSCVQCQRLNVWLCLACAETWPLFTGPLCVRCGRPLPVPDICPGCRTHPLQLSTVRSALIFEGAIRDALHALKYRGGRQTAVPLAQVMAHAWAYHGLTSNVLMPVPLFPQREAQRGYNQATLLAKALGRILRLPVASQVLTRVRNTPSQTKLDKAARKHNVAGAFALRESLDLTGWRVTLIDDVATTGATLDACAAVLLASGATEVHAFTLARAP